MASVTVFVDDAVRGDLPMYCVRTGAPTSSTMRVEKRIGGMGAAAWLLLLLGPIGWIVLAILHVRGTGRELLTVRLPYSQEAIGLERPWRVIRRVAGVVAVVAVVEAIAQLVVPAEVSAWVALIAASASLVAHTVIYFRDVNIDLDASRRWVTLSSVHPAFVDALEQRSRAR